MNTTSSPRRQSGTTLIEVLVTLLMLAFGLLGLGAFQTKAQVGSIEAYHRAQAVVLLEDIQGRMHGSTLADVPLFVTTTPLGTGDDFAADVDCSLEAVGANRDRCEWSRALKGAAEVKTGSSGSSNIGAMTGARGCVTEVQAMNNVRGVCSPGIYMVSVAWQGLHPIKTPSLACGKDLYGADTHRRAIAVQVTVGLPLCNPTPVN
ncbi:type IV pilus modification protein PilV [Massilia sp. CCM 8733]|uniref:Type IV pilus modification protein PilV n=1 Tax=Massilia mucilaginosa TaxID=2609282 RepID=A0ABX0NY36_9BURK|nr:prepilin-type N-terminal cleavage/methylation domain-containing protein [Massilia mucilaginosa]NHZ91694.1 type IV pilus modification protein PilV [Massilia mucilaginosa]